MTDDEDWTTADDRDGTRRRPGLDRTAHAAHAWMTMADLDGSSLSRTVTPGRLLVFIALFLFPLLERGLHRAAPHPGAA